MAGRIYLLNGESKLIAMEESAYDSEVLLQKLLADHPDLLAGDQINAEEPRSTDTRIRREVIGQMLDYAANAVAYWPVEEIKAKFENRCKDDELEADAELANLLGDAQDISTFWQRVKTNLQAGRVRLIFIADEIPPELRRVVEFLNSQMDPAEVIAIEVNQFVGENLKTLGDILLEEFSLSQYSHFFKWPKFPPVASCHASYRSKAAVGYER